MKSREYWEKKGDECFKNCSDYSCVRSGWCTGHASHELYALKVRKERQNKEDEEYSKFKKHLSKALKELGVIK